MIQKSSTQINAEQLRLHIRSTLQMLSLWSESVEELLLGTSAQESHLGYYRRQIKGPARGIYQMEPNTERDIWINYLTYHRDLADAVHLICGVSGPDPMALEFNLAYQTIMARLHYLRVKHPLPWKDDLDSQAEYWDKYYNCNPVKGFPSEYIRNYRRVVLS
ncbi:MAG: hypothetical protein PHZ02_07345 [Desulfocapsaceae bacterium]|nr:hypothetical protein [Desulfocapsaceae bacterium]